MACALRNFSYGHGTQLPYSYLNCFQIKFLKPRIAAMKGNAIDKMNTIDCWPSQAVLSRRIFHFNDHRKMN